MSRYRFIAAERGHYPVRRLCQVLGVPASGLTPGRPTSSGAAPVGRWGARRRRPGKRRW